MLTFCVAGYGNDFFEGIKFESEDGIVAELEFRPNRRSRPYALGGGPSEIVFFSERIDDQGKPERLARAVGRIGGDVERVLLVFFAPDLRSPPSGMSYSVLSLDESAAAFGPGDLRFLNLTGAPLLARVGAEGIEVASLDTAHARLADRVGAALDFSLSLDVEGRRQSVCTTQLVPDSLYGLLYVIKPPVRPDGLRVRLERLW